MKKQRLLYQYTIHSHHLNCVCLALVSLSPSRSCVPRTGSGPRGQLIDRDEPPRVLRHAQVDVLRVAADLAERARSRLARGDAEHPGEQDLRRRKVDRRARERRLPGRERDVALELDRSRRRQLHRGAGELDLRAGKVHARAGKAHRSARECCARTGDQQVRRRQRERLAFVQNHRDVFLQRQVAPEAHVPGHRDDLQHRVAAKVDREVVRVDDEGAAEHARQVGRKRELGCRLDVERRERVDAHVLDVVNCQVAAGDGQKRRRARVLDAERAVVRVARASARRHNDRSPSVV
ncbi:hypothetical protein PybrP1_007850 [[Pythium] brassicae (nom. inval.)]|nr:hypothetical protein PybrP1_007850 [[Pythium] brassicae (nom. inval.)]